MKWYSISTTMFTGIIAVENGIIKKSGIRCRTFIGQPPENLFNWLDARYDDYWVNELKEEPVEELGDV